jgi:enoyl-CoA hydratase/carnithine racemase
MATVRSGEDVMETYEYVNLAVEDGVAVLTLDRPPVNALSIGLYRDLAAGIAEIDRRTDEIRAAVLTGHGRCFCAGRDLKVAETEPPAVRARHVKAAMSAIYHCAVPLIAAVNGPAMGAGFCIAVLCDVIIASQQAVFAMPEIDAAVNPSVATLLRGFNQHQARALAFTGERVGPEELYRLGIVRAVVPPEALLDEALALARTFAGKNAAAMRAAKWSANEVEALLADFEHAYRAVESRVSDANMSSADRREAARAFAEKRRPVFTGQ